MCEDEELQYNVSVNISQYSVLKTLEIFGNR